jgi:alkyldihydroxyacetonephosphate synthase
MLSAGLDGSASLLMVGFESADHPVGPWIDRAVELCRDHGGEVPGGVVVTGPGSGADGGATATPAGRDGEVGAWRKAFLRRPTPATRWCG